jgi:adenosylhomocysteine nucleosidase
MQESAMAFEDSAAPDDSALRTPHSAIAVIVALEKELAHLRAALPAGQDEQRAGRAFTRTELAGRPLVLARCGIGMLSAAAVTEAIIIHYAPAAVINYGCTGAHREDVLPGDLVLGERTVAYDRVRVAPDGTEQYKPMYYLRGEQQERIAYLPAAPELLAAAHCAATRLEGQHEPWPLASGWPAGVPHRPPRLFTGVVASADRWNRAHERIRAIAGLHESLCEDMEAAAIALTCASHDVPFLTIKDISNNELLRTTDVTTFATETTGQLGRRAAALTLATLYELVKA